MTDVVALPTVAQAGLGIAALFAVARVVRPGPVADRVVGLDVLLYIVVAGVAVDATRRGDGTFLDLSIVLALLGFLGTLAAALVLERRGGGAEGADGDDRSDRDA